MLTKIYCAFSTRDVRHAGTSSQPVLILGQTDRDIIHETIDLEQANRSWWYQPVLF